jgi:COP9 signalosome complex subunit 6
MEFNESPLFLLLDPSKQDENSKKLPVSLFESELHILNGTPTMLFVNTPFKIETCETEGIAVDHVSKITPVGEPNKSSCK